MTITCVQCGRPVDIHDTVELPNGLTCLDPCYAWLEKMAEEVDLDEGVEYDDDETDADRWG